MTGPGHLLTALRPLRRENSGALVRSAPDGSHLGAIFAAHGRICWARSAVQRGRLSDLLLGEAGDGLSREQLELTVRRCREESVPLGDALLRTGRVDEGALRRALLRHTCEAISTLIAQEGDWEWVRRSGPSYSPALTFCPADITSGLHALGDAASVTHARERLAVVMLGGQLGFTVRVDELAPIAHVGCDDLDLESLIDLGAQAREVVTLGEAAAARGIIAVLADSTSATWREDRFLHVIVDRDENAFGRLVSQLATITRMEG
jgi:hypothetical protein